MFVLANELVVSNQKGEFNRNSLSHEDLGVSIRFKVLQNINTVGNMYTKS
jgi:hypothetical protein